MRSPRPLKSLFPGGSKTPEEQKIQALNRIAGAELDLNLKGADLLFHFIAQPDMQHLESAWYLTESMSGAGGGELLLARSFLYNQLSVLLNNPGLHRLARILLHRAFAGRSADAVLHRFEKLILVLPQYLYRARSEPTRFKHPLFDYAWSQILFPVMEYCLRINKMDFVDRLYGWSQFYYHRVEHITPRKRHSIENQYSQIWRAMHSRDFSAPARIPVKNLLDGLEYDFSKFDPDARLTGQKSSHRFHVESFRSITDILDKFKHDFPEAKVEKRSVNDELCIVIEKNDGQTIQLPVRSSHTGGYFLIEIPEHDPKQENRGIFNSIKETIRNLLGDDE